MKKESNLELSTELITTISRVAYQYRRALSVKSVNYGISPNEGSLMLLLYKYLEVTTASQAAKILGVTKSLVSRSVDNLTKRGYITVKQDEYDRRVQHLALTEQAKEICVNIFRDSENVYRMAIKGLDARKLATTKDVLLAVSSNFDIIGE